MIGWLNPNLKSRRNFAIEQFTQRLTIPTFHHSNEPTLMTEQSVKEPAETVVDRVQAQDLESLKENTVNRLITANEGIVRWCDRVRDPEAPFRFRWAVESLRDADVASSNYILGALDGAGLLDNVLTGD